MAHPRSSYILGDTVLKHLAKVQALFRHGPQHGSALVSGV